MKSMVREQFVVTPQAISAAPTLRLVLADHLAMTKPAIVFLLLVMALAGTFLAARGTPDATVALLTCIGVALGAGGANVFNHLLERDIDRLMGRTCRRPVAACRIGPAHAFLYGLALTIASFALVALTVNVLTAVLILSGAAFYVLIYTMWLKRATSQNIVIGGAAGAFPALAGWAAVAGDLSVPAWVLFAIVFVWTPPHFWTLAILLKEDYARAKVPMLPVVRGDSETVKFIFLYTVVLVVVSLLLPLTTSAVGWLYVGAAVLLGGAFLWYAYRLLTDPTRMLARRIYLYSLLYLALLFVAVMVDSGLRG